MPRIANPILRGFNPDPSICRVGSDYYIATSTFEWFPGVQIHHSRDLVNWKLIARPLNRVSQLDLKGVPDSCGVWAPCLSYSEGLFYLVFSNVKSFDGVWKDTPNYLVTAKEITGEWSEPIYLSSRGFDGSLFHDVDGRKWFLSMLVDHRKGKFFGGIELQEYSTSEQKLIGPIRYLTEGSALGLSEGPHLYKIKEYYYLVLAEGGTEYGHAVSIARSRSIFGPYEFHPDNPLVSAAGDPDAILQKTGHGDLVQSEEGNWFLVFLVGRPLTPLGLCTLGRETALEEIVWKDKWPYLRSLERLPRVQIDLDSNTDSILVTKFQRLNFSKKEIPIDFQSLRNPIDDSWCSFTARKGYLRLYGKESLTSLFHQSLLARRVQDFNVQATVALEFSPESFHHMAGLVFYYNTGHYHYACVSADKEGTRKFINIISSDNFEMEFQEEVHELNPYDKIFIRGHMEEDKLQFYYSKDDISYKPVGASLNAGILSDDYVRDGSSRYRPAFTGSFVGICCQDLATNSHYTDFEWFEYEELN